MSDPQAIQAAALAAVDRQILPLSLDPSGRFTAAIMALEGRRRILQRHAPMSGGSCDRCWGNEFHEATWPCEDWRDAAAGLPLDQERTEE